MELGIQDALKPACEKLLSWQFPEGYWWFTLEANETIGAGFIQLMHFIESVDSETQKQLSQRILSEQNSDGSWGLYHGAAGDLNTTVECYFALRLAGFSVEHPPLLKARNFIRKQGGLLQIRVFTRIHLALFGLVPWNAVPLMPVEMMLLPHWAPMNIYNFSSWARASIVPLLIVFAKKPAVKISFDLEELFLEKPSERKWDFTVKDHLSLEAAFVLLDKGFKKLKKIPVKNPLREQAIEKAAGWIWEHLQKTEDIYPALAYGTMAFKALGYPIDSPQMQKPLSALKRFRQSYEKTLPNIPSDESTRAREYESTLHQQCCISPVWDTPWALTALLEAGISSNDARLQKAGTWLMQKQITNPRGDWRFKNPKAKPGGWSFEFENEYFPDVDDTIQVLAVLDALDLPAVQKDVSIQRGLDWMLSMQNNDGGWGAFDKNNDLELVNKIPFSDHGACLDPSSPDITGRAVELLANLGFTEKDKLIQKAVRYLLKTQEKFGGWYGRWGVNYIYGTWCALTGLHALQPGGFAKATKLAVHWIKNIQHRDGGFSESPESYVQARYVPYLESVASQTAWGAMALTAAGEAKSAETKRATDWLCNRLHDGTWEEEHSTGTGFPGHFYIRYHGYRHYFPLLALARYRNALR